MGWPRPGSTGELSTVLGYQLAENRQIDLLGGHLEIGPAIEVGDHGRVGLVIANQYLVGERSDALGYRQQLASIQVVAVNGVLAEDHPRLAFLHTSEDGFQPFTGIGPGALRMGVVGAEDEA